VVRCGRREDCGPWLAVVFTSVRYAPRYHPLRPMGRVLIVSLGGDEGEAWFGSCRSALAKLAL